jgi:hypothetical protein
MSVMFVDIVEEVKQLSSDEKEELKQLLDKYIIEERREEILRSYEEGKLETADGSLKFSSDMDELEAMLDD